MPADLPTTAIGLIAFIVAGAGYLLWRITKTQTETFMTYIEKKNGNLERATKLFTEAMEAQELRHRDTLIQQSAQHKEMMDDFAGRLENLIPRNPSA
jgi:iron uptake system EfeUOB component EfeO/EfeM